MHNAGVIYGYARVSTDAQDLTNQVAQLKAAGCAPANIFREKISGATAERPQLKKLMGKLVAGDVVVIAAVDRLSRDTTDLLIIARDIQKASAGLRSLAEPVLDTTGDFAELCACHAWRCRQAGTPPHHGAHGARTRRRKSQGREVWSQTHLDPAPAERGT
jgi:hypothetical protein